MKSEIENKTVRNGDGACVREGQAEGNVGRKRREEVLVTGKCLILCIQKDRFGESNNGLCSKSSCRSIHTVEWS